MKPFENARPAVPSNFNDELIGCVNPTKYGKLPMKSKDLSRKLSIGLGLSILLSGCAYPEIVESIRSGDLPKLVRTDPRDVSEKFLGYFPAGSRTAIAVQRLRDSGFNLRKTFPQPYLELRRLDVTWRGGRNFRKDGGKFDIAVQIDSRDGEVVEIRAVVKKYYF